MSETSCVGVTVNGRLLGITAKKEAEFLFAIVLAYLAYEDIRVANADIKFYWALDYAAPESWNESTILKSAFMQLFSEDRIGDIHSVNELFATMEDMSQKIKDIPLQDLFPEASFETVIMDPETGDLPVRTS